LILTLDLGTSTTKAVVWDADGPRARGRAALTTEHPAADRAEQDPGRWWPALVEASAAARADSPESFAAVEAVGFAAARQTLVPVTAAGEPRGPALVWSDRRAEAEAAALAETLGGAAAARRRTGAVLDGAAVAAKAAWLAAHDPGRFAVCRWLLTPRDLMLWRLTGEPATDVTMVSAAGLSDAKGELVAELVSAIGDRLPPVLAPDAVAGSLTPGAAAELGLRPGLPVVVGAGDRACEVLGAGASPATPMVSWGTTANVSVPVALFPEPVPAAVTVTRAAAGGWLLEGGLSAAGSLLGWLATITGPDVAALMAAAAATGPGAHGVIALPWLAGARAPWWRPGAGGAFVGLGFEHGPGDLARAAVESVAYEVRRCLEATQVSATSLAVTGADGTTAPWLEVLTAVTGLPAAGRRSGQAASAGAALLTSAAVGAGYELDRLDPVVATVTPYDGAVARYDELRPAADAAALAVLSLERPLSEAPR
jgi:xylulokinase